MSFLRKTVLTTAVIGAGLVSTAGAAFACDNPGGDEHHGHHGSHSTTVDSNNDSSCSNGVGTGDKTGNGLIGVGNVLDAPITANVCHVLENNGNGNGNGNKLDIGGGLLGGAPDLGGLLGSGAGAAPSAQTFQAAPAQAAPVQQAAPAQAAPAPAPAPATAVPAGTSTTPIQG